MFFSQKIASYHNNKFSHESLNTISLVFEALNLDSGTIIIVARLVSRYSTYISLGSILSFGISSKAYSQNFCSFSAKPLTTAQIA